MNDILIIGSGVIGLSTARALSRYKASIRVIDAAYDVSEGCSKANSAIVHAGYDAEPGTLKARLNVRGSEMYPDLCRELGVPYRRNGALILAFSEDDRGTIEKLYQQGMAKRIRELRMEKAKSLLREQRDLPLAEVAWQCGYQDYNYFFTVFKREVGCTPKEWRNEHI